eukprot:SAG31_NODE_19661_length_595_cov_0.919355_1_plen_140_part_10
MPLRPQSRRRTTTSLPTEDERKHAKIYLERVQAVSSKDALEASADAPSSSILLLEFLEICNMGMLWTTLPALLESDTKPGRWGLITGLASAIGLGSGALFGRLSDIYGRRAVLLLAVSLFTSSPLLLASGQGWSLVAGAL